MNTKKTVLNVFFIIIIVIIITTIFILAYILLKNGNNINNKSEDRIIDDILKLKTYNARMEIDIETNKNHTKYIINQSLDTNNICKQEVLEPSNISGLVTEYDGKNLKIIYNKQNLIKTFENYDYLVSNNLWLNSFVNDFSKENDTNISQKNDEIVLEVKLKNGNKYSCYKKLFISNISGKPTKMIIQDINQKTLINILYTEIEIS